MTRPCVGCGRLHIVHGTATRKRRPSHARLRREWRRTAPLRFSVTYALGVTLYLAVVLGGCAWLALRALDSGVGLALR